MEGRWPPEPADVAGGRPAKPKTGEKLEAHDFSRERTSRISLSLQLYREHLSIPNEGILFG